MHGERKELEGSSWVKGGNILWSIQKNVCGIERKKRIYGICMEGEVSD